MEHMNGVEKRPESQNPANLWAAAHVYQLMMMERGSGTEGSRILRSTALFWKSVKSAHRNTDII